MKIVVIGGSGLPPLLRAPAHLCCNTPESATSGMKPASISPAHSEQRVGSDGMGSLPGQTQAAMPPAYAGRRRSATITGLAIAQLLSSGCAILRTLQVVNFGHLDGLVVEVYDWSRWSKFLGLIKGAEPNGE